jgi:hypothetical protein
MSHEAFCLVERYLKKNRPYIICETLEIMKTGNADACGENIWPA